MRAHQVKSSPRHVAANISQETADGVCHMTSSTPSSWRYIPNSRIAPAAASSRYTIWLRRGGRFTARSLHAAAASQDSHHTNHTIRTAISGIRLIMTWSGIRYPNETATGNCRVVPENGQLNWRLGTGNWETEK